MPGPFPRRRSLLTPSLLACLAGCGGGGATQRAVEESGSWVATMQLLAEMRHTGAVPSTYARTLRRAADEALAEGARTIRDPASGASPADRALFAARRRAALATPLP